MRCPVIAQNYCLQPQRLSDSSPDVASGGGGGETSAWFPVSCYFEMLNWPANSEGCFDRMIQSSGCPTQLVDSPIFSNIIDNAIQCTSRLARLVNSPKFSDVVLVVGDREYHAHRLLLANSSYVFE